MQSEVSLDDASGDAMADTLHYAMQDGPSRQMPCPYRDPEQTLLAGQVWTTFESALCDLPGIQADVFVKHELSALGVDEICGEMAISEVNFYVLIHRARKRLQSRMEHCRTIE